MSTMTTLLHHFRANLNAFFVTLDERACGPHVSRLHLSDAVLSHDTSIYMMQKFAVQGCSFVASGRTGTRAKWGIDFAGLACLSILSMATPASVRVFFSHVCQNG